MQQEGKPLQSEEVSYVMHNCSPYLLAAYLNNVPFLVIRAISDKADGSAEMDYPTFEAQAAEHSFKLTLRILKDIQG